MCYFLVIMCNSTNGVIKKGVEFCSNGKAGNICIDTNKVPKSNYNNVLHSNCGNVIVNTSLGSYIVLENLLKEQRLLIEYSLLLPYMSQIEHMDAKGVWNMYWQLKHGRQYSASSTTSASTYIDTNIDLPEVDPDDSISSVETKYSNESSIKGVTLDQLKEINRQKNKSKNKYSGSSSTTSKQSSYSANKNMIVVYRDR